MVLRQLAALVILGLGIWLAYGGLNALLTIVDRGSGLGDALFNPPTTIIRLVASGLMILGGLVALLKLRGGGLIAIAGSVLFLVLGGFMAAAGGDQSLWMDEVLYGFGGLVSGILILTLKRT